jgi:DNA topoisomerase-1
MATKLVIVESPAKAKTIAGYLGKDYEVLASIGHIRDLVSGSKSLPEDVRKKWWADYGVNVEEGFEPYYEVPSEKSQQVSKLRQRFLGTCFRCSIHLRKLKFLELLSMKSPKMRF